MINKIKSRGFMKKIVVFNTAISSENIGDYIIMDSVNKVIYDLFENDMVFETLTHDAISKPGYKLNKIADYSFVGGSNLLSSNMNRYNQWKVNLKDSLFLDDILLLGVGWWQYQKKPNLYTKILFKRLLSNNKIHSVRDSYTEKMLKSIGINNVLNTGCPTMWGLTPEHCAKIPSNKGDCVVFTLTDYNKNVARDLELINILLKNYKTVYFWPQGSGDFNYFKLLGNHNEISVLGANLIAFDRLLDNKKLDVDFIGTRLHAGIRALQKSRRSIIIGIDNRATEKKKDFNLNVISRDSLNELEQMISVNFETQITLNTNNIELWKKQFQ